jgi:hypothetical protein
MAGNRQLQILLLVFASLLGIVIGVWLLSAGFVALGCAFIALFLWRGQQFAIWLAVPRMAPADVTPPLSSLWQRLLLSIVCLLGAGTCAVGVYLWRMWPEEWQVGLVFILFGLIVLAPVTMWTIRTRRSQIDSVRGG